MPTHGWFGGEVVGFVTTEISFAGGRRSLHSRRKPRERRQRLPPRLRVAEIDFRLEKRDLTLKRALVDVHIPGPRPPVAPVVPAVSSSLEGVLQLERRLLGPDAHRRLAGGLEQEP